MRRPKGPRTGFRYFSAGAPTWCGAHVSDSNTADVFDVYVAGLGRLGGPLDADTMRVCASRLRQYLARLATANAYCIAFGERAVRERAVRDYRAHLLTVAGRRPATVNSHLTALVAFYRRRARVRRRHVAPPE